MTRNDPVPGTPGVTSALENKTPLLPSLESGSRILIIRLRSMGDTVLLTPALRLLKQWRNDLRVSVLVEPRFRELLEGNPRVDETLSAVEGSGLQKAWRQAQLIRALRARKFAVCLNVHGGPTSAWLTRLSGARWKAGFEHFRSRRLYDFAVPDARRVLGQEIVHTAEHQAAALFWLGLPRQPVPPAEVFVSEAGRRDWQQERKRLGLAPHGSIALLHPPALYATKQWPAERFAQLGCYVEEQLGLTPVFSCGPGESTCLDEVERAAGRAVCRLDSPPLAMFVAAIADSRLFVGNDSGPAHLAAAFRKPLVVIFGSSNERIWRPWSGSGQAQVGGSPFRTVQNSYSCNPCRGDRCTSFERPECILSVTFDQARAAVESVASAVAQR